ncbi:Metal-dependent hydrolase, endonuclease/exonuclease/phosphatase family [Paracoccus isoporae]|uniref:Metal-dependent hydrolase, endonuclease/exonuclease/phosphatase family n=1 Tax=Paracoccus isoporae TaxID=591205 RepID=A0A1G6X6I8_9RHOB|nr:endonuclease/exonuclease/phosphatase family protein [Paracoccus isoporae]SDD73729.1 Metal-dependent hydrolase, endonuclease/exonuclease/phosphatase family [Paracoccus isoporae]
MKLRVASYNLHKCRGMTGPHAPERNLQVIAELNPDIIALQEVDFRLGARPEALPRAMIAEMTGLEPMQMRTTGETSLGWHGQAVLMKPELAEQAVMRRLPLPGIEPRGALALRIGGLTLIGVHLGLARSSRRQQLARLVAKASRLAGDAVMLMGDFNEWRGTRGLESLDPLHLLTPGPTYPAPMPRLPLDRIAVSAALRVTATGVGDSATARQASDHLPIWAEIELS